MEDMTRIVGAAGYHNFTLPAKFPAFQALPADGLFKSFLLPIECVVEKFSAKVAPMIEHSYELSNIVDAALDIAIDSGDPHVITSLCDDALVGIDNLQNPDDLHLFWQGFTDLAFNMRSLIDHYGLDDGSGVKFKVDKLTETCAILKRD